MSISNNPENKRRTFVSALLSALLFSALAGTLLVDVSLANPYVRTNNSAEVRIYLPETNIYDVNYVSVSFEVESERPSSWFISSVYGIRFYLDGDSCENIIEPAIMKDSLTRYSATLVGLEDGFHSLYVVAYVKYYASMLQPADGSGVSNVFYFHVYATPPDISILSVQNKNYGTADIALNFTVNEPVSWIGYSLDGEANVTITDKTVLTSSFGQDNYYMVLPKLPEGSHTLVVYAEDTYGILGESEPFHFTVTEETQPQPSKPPLASQLIAVAIIASAIIVSFGLLAYFVKFRKKRNL